VIFRFLHNPAEKFRIAGHQHNVLHAGTSIEAGELLDQLHQLSFA